MKTEFLELIQTRRSCRKYQAQQITDEELKAVLEAGTSRARSRHVCTHFARTASTLHRSHTKRRLT